MKLFIALIFCSFASFISADYYNPATTCKCVPRELCSYKFSPLIEPRSAKFFCAHNQVCCKPEHVVPISKDTWDDSAYEDDSAYDSNDYQIDSPANAVYPADSNKPNHPNTAFRQCGQRTKISAYKRLVLPAAYAALGEFPWQSAILRNYSEGFVFISSGVLIEKDIILTTAHNVDKLATENLLVRLGENNVQADPKRKYHHVNARVSKVLVKDDFNSDTLENDFAVLCLEKKVRCNEVVSPICLPEPGDFVSDNARCVVSGWGKGSYNGNYSTVLRKAYLNLVPQDQCQFLIRKRISDPTYVLDKSFTCAGGELGKDACTGDAGGPLATLNKQGQQVLVGIVSWGIGCGEKNVPGVYANVRDPASLNWIKNVAIPECRRRNVPYVSVPPSIAANPNFNPNFNQNVNNPNNPNYNPNVNNPNSPNYNQNVNNPNYNGVNPAAPANNYNGIANPNNYNNVNGPNYNPNYPNPNVNVPNYSVENLPPSGYVANANYPAVNPATPVSGYNNVNGPNYNPNGLNSLNPNSPNFNPNAVNNNYHAGNPNFDQLKK